jgi:hypothetical protein
MGLANQPPLPNSHAYCLAHWMHAAAWSSLILKQLQLSVCPSGLGMCMSLQCSRMRGSCLRFSV